MARNEKIINISLHRGCIDAATIAAMLETAFEDSPYKVKITEYGQEEFKVRDRLKALNENKYDFLFFTDLNLSNAETQYIKEMLKPENISKIAHIDHHKLNLVSDDKMEKHLLEKQIHVSPNIIINPNARSAARLVYLMINSFVNQNESRIILPEEIINVFRRFPKDKLEVFGKLVEHIDKIDTIGPEGLDQKEQEIADFFKAVGFKNFKNIMKNNPSIDFNEEQTKLIGDYRQKKVLELNQYIKKIEDNIETHTGVYNINRNKGLFLKLMAPQGKDISCYDIINALKHSNINIQNYSFVEIIRANGGKSSIIPLGDFDFETLKEKLHTKGHEEIVSHSLGVFKSKIMINSEYGYFMNEEMTAVYSKDIVEKRKLRLKKPTKGMNYTDDVKKALRLLDNAENSDKKQVPKSSLIDKKQIQPTLEL